MITAELLCIMVEVARQLDCISSQKWEIRIGHRNLIVAAARYMGFGDFNSQNKILNVLYAISTSNKMLRREQRIERLRVGTEMSFNQANSLLNVLEGDEYSLEALIARTQCLISCRDDSVQELVRSAIDVLTNVSLLLESFVGAGSYFKNFCFLRILFC
ncbi:unnamed protein product [Gongylonema pulchrum]|uniref:DSHCT domain-containing protein n=1 Tax=Gongylonema pulchrum TaxID=637853 RepID=A0A183DGN2_9BILA|nr:unnamed protein product [Gongylonema pulchrum]